MSEMGRLGMEFGQHVLKMTQELLMGQPRNLSEMERSIREALLRLGQFLWGVWLMLQEGAYPPQRIVCRCGGEARYRCKREAVLRTLLGRLTYRRTYYVCAHGHQGTYPLDERLGLRPGEMSAELESLEGMTGALMTFAKGSELFEHLTLIRVSPLWNCWYNGSGLGRDGILSQPVILGGGYGSHRTLLRYRRAAPCRSSLHLARLAGSRGPRGSLSALSRSFNPRAHSRP